MSYSDLSNIQISKDDTRLCKPDCDCHKHRKNVVCEDIKDRRLANWDNWIKMRREVGEKIQRVINRKPSSLLMNTDENFRAIQETKLIFNNANTPLLHKHYDSNPGFFKIPDSLKKICCEEQTYYTQLSMDEKGMMKEMEFVGKSNFIKELMGTASKRKSNWDKNDYSQAKLRSKEVQSLRYYRPEMSALALICNSLPSSIKRIKILDPVVETSTTAIDNEHLRKKIAVEVKRTLIILNNIPVNSEDLKNIRVIFIDFSKPEILSIENKTKYVLRFYFIEDKRSFYLFPDLIRNSAEQVFYFNRNIHIIQPEERLMFPFWFKSKQIKSCVESYQMIIIPSLFKKISITLQADSCDSNNFHNKCLKLVDRLESKTRNRIVKEVLEDLTSKIGVHHEGIVHYKYDKAMIFEAVNSTFGPFSFDKHKYYYDKRVVDKLEKFYQKVRLEQHSEYWDYKISTLRLVTKERNLFEEEKNLEVILEKINEELQIKTNDLKASKRNIIKNAQNDKTINLEKELDNVIGELVCSNKTKDEVKLLKIFANLFCSYIDRTVEDISELEENLGIQSLLPKIRQYYHRYEEELTSSCTIFSKPFYNWIRKEAHQQSPKWTLEIPLEDYKQRYKAFHSVSEVRAGSKHTNKSIKSKSKRSNSNRGRSINTPTTVTSHSSSKINKFEDTSDVILEISEEDVQVLKSRFKKYAENTYIIFYTKLCKYFEDFETIMEMFSATTVRSLSVIKNVEQEDVVKPDSTIEVRIFDLKRAISRALGAPRGLVHSKHEKEELFDVPNYSSSCSSLWTLLDAYKKEKSKRLEPRYEGDLYYLSQQDKDRSTYFEKGTSVMEFKEDLEKSVQVDICTSEESTAKELGLEEEICVCSSSITSSMIGENIGYYDSCGDFKRSSNSEEIKSCKSSET